MEEKKTLRIGGIDVEKFNIVYPTGKAVEEFLAEELAKIIEAATGKKPAVVSDEYVTVEHEIRLGVTNRTPVPAPAAEGEEVVEAEPLVAKGAYRITVVKKNVEAIADNVFGYEDILAKIAELLAAEGDTEWNTDDEWTGTITNNPIVPDNYDICILYHNILGYLPWYPAVNRAAMGLQLYEEYMPDVIGLQEVSNFYYRDTIESVKALKALGYEEVRYPRYGYGNPIYYNAKKLELLESGYKCARRGDKGTTWAVLRIKKSGGKKFVMVNSHFAADSNAKNDHNLGNLYRTEDAKVLVEVVEMAKQRYPGIAVFTGGDYNSALGSEAIQTAFDGGLVSIRDVVEDKTHCDFCAYNGYPKYDQEANRYGYEEFHLREARGNIDFVMLGGNQEGVTVHDYVVMKDRISCTVSDHLPHFCHISLPKPEVEEDW